MATTPFTARMDKNKLAALDAVAADMDRSRNYILNEAVEAYLEQRQQYIAAVEDGLSELENGQGLAHDKVMSNTRTLVNTLFNQKKGD